MNNNATQATVLQGLMADEINAFIQYVEYSATRDNSEHAELHQAILEVYNDLPTWVQQQMDFKQGMSVKCSPEEGAPIITTDASTSMVGLPIVGEAQQQLNPLMRERVADPEEFQNAVRIQSTIHRLP